MKRERFERWVIKSGGQSKVAAKLRVSRQSVHQWIRGLHIPHPDTLKKIMELSNSYITAQDFYSK